MTTRQDALDLLKADHQDVMRQFEAFAALRERDASPIEKAALAEQICLSLSVQAQLEDEVFFPAAEAAIDDAALMNAARAELCAARALIVRTAETAPSDPQHDDAVLALGAATAQREKAAHAELFPRLRKSNTDLMALGARLQRRRGELMAEHKNRLGRNKPEDEAADPVGQPVPLARSDAR